MSGIIGLISVSAAVPGASEVQQIALNTANPSDVVATLKTPTSGKRLRIISVTFSNSSSSGPDMYIWFGTAWPPTTPTKIFFETNLDGDIERNMGQTWPDGGGPIGDVDEVVSFVTGSNITTEGTGTIVFREE